MSQTPITSTSQNKPASSVPTQNADGSNVLPSTTTERGAELASTRPVSGGLSSRLPSLAEQTGGDSTPGLHRQPDDQAAATSTSTVPSNEAGEIASLAYGYYEAEGYPEGCALEHWTRAEQEARARRGK